MKILVASSGAIATSLLPQWLLILRQFGRYEFRVVLTPSAARFVSASAISAVTGGSVYTDDDAFPSDGATTPPHLDLATWADVILFVPATYNSLMKLKLGIADNLLHTVMAFSESPIIAVPAISPVIAKKDVYKRMLTVLKERGINFVVPSGPTLEVSSGEYVTQAGAGMASFEEVAAAILEYDELKNK
jgi:phosphopantothenoylcysteine synthetase/decarboxylase